MEGRLQRPPPTHKPKPGEATMRKIRRSTMSIDSLVRPQASNTNAPSKPAPLVRSVSSHPSTSAIGRGQPLNSPISPKSPRVGFNPPSSFPPSTPPPPTPNHNNNSSSSNINAMSNMSISTPNLSGVRVKSGSRISGRHYQDAPIKLSRMHTSPQLIQSPSPPNSATIEYSSLPQQSVLPSYSSQNSSPPSHSAPTPPPKRPAGPSTGSVYSRTPAHAHAVVPQYQADALNEQPSTCQILTLSASAPEHNVGPVFLQFSPFSSVNEALQQILLLLLNIDAGPDILRNYAVYSPPGPGDTEGCYMTAERTLQSYFLTDGDEIQLWERPQTPTLIKIEIERGSMTFKVDEDTTVWFIVVKLLKKLQTRNADDYLKGRPQEFGLYLCHTYLEQEVYLEEDAFITSFNVTSHTKLVFKKKPDYVDTGDLTLRLLNDWDGLNYKTVTVEANNTVFAALKKLVKIHPVSDYNQYGLYYMPPGSSRGIWLEEDQFLSTYRLKNNDFIEFKKKYRAYAVKLPYSGEVVYKLDEFATAKQLFDIIIYNCNGLYTADQYWLFVRGGPMIDMSRGLWSYPVCSKVGLELKPSAQPLDVWYQGKKESFEVDYSLPLDYFTPYLFERFQQPQMYPGEFCLIQLNVAGILLDTSKSLLEQGVSHKGVLLLTGPDGSCPIPVIRQDDEQLAVNIWDEPTNDSTIIYDKEAIKGQPLNIEAATLNKLVERLTSPTTHDLDYMKAFLMTYLSFTTPQALFIKLMERFEVPRSVAKQPENLFPIQLRTCNTLKYWIETRYQDFSHELTMDVLLFIDRISQREETKRLGRQLRETLTKRTSGMKETTAVPSTPTPNSSRLSSSTAAGAINGKPTDPFFEFDPSVVARQITLQDFKFYQKIEPTELLNQCWSKPEVQHLAPNLMVMIDRFNTIGSWVASLILKAPKVKQRAARWDFLIKVAEHLKELNNFSSLMAFISAMNNSSIDRLKFTKAQLSKKGQQCLKELEKLMSTEGSFKNYRVALHRANPPCLPYLAVYLKDLTFIEDGNPNKINGLINFGKRRLLYTAISEMQQFQQKAYSISPDPTVEAYLSDVTGLDEKELYNISLQCEPRGATRVD